jgi:hypothetical protein
MAGTWSTLLHQPGVAIDTMLLLTDGTVMAHELSTPNWHRLSPDSAGHYENGLWSALPAMPNNAAIPAALGGPTYAPLFFGAAVLQDGSVFIAGGEYNHNVSADMAAAARFNPQTNTWTTLGGPAGWTHVGDVSLCVLANGHVLLASIDDNRTAFFDPATNAYSAGPNKLDRGAEESLTLMPDGTVLVVQCTAIPGSEKYVPGSNSWVSAGNTPATLPQSLPGIVAEIGATVLLTSGHAFAIGATGATALYSPGPTPAALGTWTAGPTLKSGATTMHPSDAPAVLLPNGKVLLTGSPPATAGNSFPGPTTFFEYDPTTNTVAVVGAAANAATPCFQGRFLLLPSGKVLYSSQGGTIAVYTPDLAPAAAWRPVITSISATLHPGSTYTLTGQQLNGLSQACFYGDDATMATNYPIVRLTNTGTGVVTYCRTANHSTMAVATGVASVTTQVTVPAGLANGAYSLEVIANGIPSLPHAVTVATKSVIKDHKDLKIEIKEFKEHKEFKEFKIEGKIEIKELKHEIKELEKPIVENKLKDAEGDLNQLLQMGGDPAWLSSLQQLSDRVDQLAQGLQQRAPITPAERPAVGDAPLLHSKHKKVEGAAPAKGSGGGKPGSKS